MPEISIVESFFSRTILAWMNVMGLIFNSYLILNIVLQVFSSLRDDNGEPYDPTQYTLEHSSDGNVFLMPTNHTTSTNSRNNQSQEHTEKNSRKRKGSHGKKSGK